MEIKELEFKIGKCVLFGDYKSYNEVPIAWNTFKNAPITTIKPHESLEKYCFYAAQPIGIVTNFKQLDDLSFLLDILIEDKYNYIWNQSKKQLQLLLMINNYTAIIRGLYLE